MPNKKNETNPEVKNNFEKIVKKIGTKSVFLADRTGLPIISTGYAEEFIDDLAGMSAGIIGCAIQSGKFMEKDVKRVIFDYENKTKDCENKTETYFYGFEHHVIVFEANDFDKNIKNDEDINYWLNLIYEVLSNLDDL